MTAGTLARRTALGRTFTSSNRTYAHLLWTIAELERLYPGARLVIIQTCYHQGVPESVGTHDFDGVFDVRIEGLTWWDAQLFLRRCGWAAWYRYPPLFGEHIHMCSIPEGLTNTPTIDDIDRAYQAAGIQVGIFVPGQIDDYFAHALGLKGQHRAGVDRSRFPRDIASTIYRYQEDDDMPYNNWPQADKDALVRDIWARTDADGNHAGATLSAIGKAVTAIAAAVAAIRSKIGA